LATGPATATARASGSGDKRIRQWEERAGGVASPPPALRGAPLEEWILDLASPE
jgi:hypothetical protein